MEAEDHKRNHEDIESSVVPSKKKNRNGKKNIYLVILKAIVMLLCLFGFIANSFIIFKQFIGKETVTSYKIQDSSELRLPSVTLCGYSGFKRIVKSYDDLKHDRYINNTIDVNEILMEVIDNDNNSITAPYSMTFEGPIYDKSRNWKIKTTYSAYRGRCYTIEYRKKVKNEILVVVYFVQHLLKI